MNCVDAGNVFVHLFMQTKEKYLLTNKKLQYLLVIAQMTAVTCGRSLFDEDIRNFKHSFVIDKIGDSFMAGAPIVNGRVIDKPLRYTDDCFVVPFTNKRMYAISELPSELDEKLLVRTFIAFGGYSEQRLASMFNGLAPLRNVRFFQAVEHGRIRGFFLHSFRDDLRNKRYAENAVYAFVRGQYAQYRKSAVKQEAALKEKVAEKVRQLAEDAAGCHKDSNATIAPLVVLPVLLKGVESLNSIVAGKRYSVLVELPSSEFSCWLSVLTVGGSKELSVEKEMVGENLFRFSFVSVADDIKLVPHVVRAG